MNENSRSLWQATAHTPYYPPLRGMITADVCIVGAGIAGLTTAYMLAKQGVSVAVLEAFEVGSGETGRTTAHIAVPDDRYWAIEEAYGVDVSRGVAASFAAAADAIEAIVRNENIECEFERLDGYLFSCAADPLSALQKELAAAERAGVHAALTEAALGSSEPGPALQFPRQAQFHPLRYLTGLANAIVRFGGRIFCGSRALEVSEPGDGVIVRTQHGKVDAGSAVVATNTPFIDRVAIHVKQFAYQTYALGAAVERGSVPRALMWDDADPYHYVRLASAPDGAGEILIVGGADHKTGQERDAAKHHDQLAAWLRERFPQAGPVQYRWSGEVLEPLDGLAYIGRNPGSQRTYVITGDSGNGISHGTIGGLLIQDLIAGRTNRWSEIYDPTRKAFKEGVHFLKAQSNIAAQYADWLSPGDGVPAEELAPGQGAIVRAGLKKLAIYRDTDGVLRGCSAVCPHLGCIVRWNDQASTWDCPCHGSRFTAEGAVFHGPAASNLEPVDDETLAALARPSAHARKATDERAGK
jgi:glycine/D-amino acid oxidase-like deaminating enzyme/nitrite reductase/ring-hydroxylating ferredoxin subunit